MKESIASIFVFGWIDLLNPVSVSMVMLLLPLVRQRWHVLLYIGGAYVAYSIASIAIYFGVDKYLSALYRQMLVQHPFGMSVCKVAIGLIALAGCLFMIRFLWRAIQEKRELNMEKMLMIKSVAPWFIVALSFGSTWSNMFGAIAMFAYIGVLMQNSIHIATAIWLIPLFCLFSVVPTMTVYLLSTRVTGERFQKIMGYIRKGMTAFCLYSIPILLGIVSWWGLSSGIPGIL